MKYDCLIVDDEVMLSENTQNQPLAFQLALKQLLQAKRQALMICAIIAGVTFASVMGIAAYYNMSVDMTSFVHTIAGDMSDVLFVLDSPDEGEGFVERMSDRPEVESIFGTQSIMLSVDGNMILTTIVEDFSYLEGHSLVDGRFPIHDNEIAVAVPVLNIIGKGLGDWVTIVSGEDAHEYLVTGTVQNVQFNGLVGSLSLDGLRQVQPDFDFFAYSVNLAYGVDAAHFIETIQVAERDVLLNVVFFQGQVDAQLGMLSDIFTIVSTIIISVVAAIVVLVLYLVIKTTILRRRRELGIQKALGYTTFQLMNQIALNLTPTIFIGVIVGAIAGYYSFNPIFVAMLSDMGIVQANMILPIAWVVMLCIAVVLISYTVSMLISW